METGALPIELHSYINELAIAEGSGAAKIIAPNCSFWEYSDGPYSRFERYVEPCRGVIVTHFAPTCPWLFLGSRVGDRLHLKLGNRVGCRHTLVLRLIRFIHRDAPVLVRRRHDRAVPVEVMLGAS